MIQNYVISFVRTYVMLGVGALVTWLGESQGVIIDSKTSNGLVVLAMLIVTAVYYFVVRALEHWQPKLGVLLGVPAKPKYEQVAGALDNLIETAPKPASKG